MNGNENLRVKKKIKKNYLFKFWIYIFNKIKEIIFGNFNGIYPYFAGW